MMEYFISTDRGLLNEDFISDALATTYWAGARSRDVIRKSIAGSLCFGIYARSSKQQIGFARVVTDNATFGWVCDVFVHVNHRSKGLGKQLIEAIVMHSDLDGVPLYLGTKDAHSLYEKYGFAEWEVMRRPFPFPPNQSLEPTSKAVTHPATAGCAPALGVAQH